MAYTAYQLITRAFYLSQIVSRDLDGPNPSQVSDGLYLLNALLDFKGSDLRLIPYYTHYDFDSVQGQEKYFIPNLYLVDTLTFNIGDVRYPMREMTRVEYFATARVDNIQSLPFSYRVERQLKGSDIYLYFNPAAVYQMKLWGKFALTDVALTTDLSLIYDTYYIEYLRHALCYWICCEWGATMPDASMAHYKEIQKKLMDISPPDLSVVKRSYFGKSYGYDWQEINLTEGYVPF